MSDSRGPEQNPSSQRSDMPSRARNSESYFPRASGICSWGDRCSQPGDTGPPSMGWEEIDPKGSMNLSQGLAAQASVIGCTPGGWSEGMRLRAVRRKPNLGVPPGSLADVTVGACKPRGLHAARKLRNQRRDNRWADKSYKKRALGTAYRSSPTGGSSHAKGIVLEKVGVEAKQPNSAIRKCVRVQLIKNGKKVTAFVPNDGCLNFLDDNDEVLIAGFGRAGHAKGDIPGVRFKVVKVSGVGLLALWLEKKEKPRS
ncbi:hypothetical protein PSTG_09460 [Puccinia striiformis f. sp. tritici PST-78]|uniref:40S ribosomal protein S23 n=3 Tax=Puccinia striiformis TaxID=27350 RepID=A0A0L0VD32_9BASI|nr:hypothetical protein PSTG_09460 [Puccinia striiformis f. sp. tritici PST-78]